MCPIRYYLVASMALTTCYIEACITLPAGRTLSALFLGQTYSLCILYLEFIDIMTVLLE